MARLGNGTAARIAVRELRSSRGKFFFVILSVAIGVAALTGVRGFATAFRSMLTLRARSIMAGDVSAKTTQQPTAAEARALEAMSAGGTERTEVTELTSMASSPVTFDPLLVSVKAIDPNAYPYYGSVELSSLPAGTPLSQVLTPGTVAVGEDLLTRLHMRVGDSVKLGHATYRIVAVVENEPDRLSGNFAAGPRVLMSLVALVLGAVGVGMAMRAHLQERLDSIAIMKSLGAGTPQILKIYVLQTLLLGLAGGVLGVLLGAGVQLAFPLFLAKLLHITPAFRLDPRAMLSGIAAGLLTTLLFTLPPLLDIRNVRPILVFRRAMESTAGGTLGERVAARLRGNLIQIPAVLVLLAGCGALAASVSASRRVGFIFFAGLVVVLLVLLGLSALLLLLLRLFLQSTRLHLPSAVRHGLANLYRPGNPSAALLAALGLGVMQIMSVYFVQEAVVRELHISTAANLPNMFLIDIAGNEVEGLRALLKQRPEVQGEPEIIPVVGSRLTAVNGIPIADYHPHTGKVQDRGPMQGGSSVRGMQRSLNLTWSPREDGPPPGDKVIEGHWWNAGQARDAAAHPLVAIGEFQARRLAVHPGDTLTMTAQDQSFTATIAALYDTDSQHTYSRAEFILPEASLRGLPTVWYGGVHSKPGDTGGLERALYAAYPTVTVINVAATLEVVRQVILQITYVIQFLAAFSVFAGVVILASAIAGTRYRRVREVVVLKALGATRRRIAAIFSIEFAVLGLVAATVGLIFANISAAAILHWGLKVEYFFRPWLTLFALAVASLITVAAGWLASHRVLGQKPLEVLREE